MLRRRAVFRQCVKIGRNDRCWCGSGEKYKKCHLDRGRLPRVTRQETLTEIRRAENRRVCFHPLASKDSCGPVIKAHSIQRSGSGLNAIARRGHVYGYETGFGVIDKTGREVMPKLIGVREASTFTGFCDLHDSQLFRALETEPIQPTAEQLTLLAFRAICRDLMAKQFALAANPYMKASGDRGLPPLLQVFWQKDVGEQAFGNQLAIADLSNAQRKFAAAILSRDFSAVRALVFHFDSVPAVLVSSPITPEFDFGGRILQDLNDASRLADVMTFSMIGCGDDAGMAAFVWMEDIEIATQFVSSLATLALAAIPHRLVQFAFEYFENVFWSPGWWDGLSSTTRDALIDRMNSRPKELRPARFADDGTRSASWAVNSIATLTSAGWSS